MKIEGTHGQLHSAIATAEKVSGKNLTLPVLNCLFLKVEKKTLTIRATNLDLGIEISLPVKAQVEGEVVVPGGVLNSTLATVPNDTAVTLESEEGNLVVRTKNGVATIKAQPHDDFPTIPKPQGGQTISLKRDLFLDGIKSVWFAASLSAIKPELSSVYVHQHDGKLYFAATDSFRLAEKIIVGMGTLPDFEPLLIPLKNIPEIIRIVERAPEEIEITLTQNQISFAYDELFLTSRLVDGVFPDYQQIIPKEKVTEAIVLKQDMMTLLKKTTIFSDSFNQIRFDLDPQKKTFTLMSKNNDVGETSDTLEAAITGEPLEISFNHKYITDCFQALHADSISLSFGGLSKPMVIRGVSDPSFLYLVMPMNK